MIQIDSNKAEYPGTEESFSESMLDLSSIMLFSTCFPLGPAFLIIQNIIDIRTELFQLLFIVKRPPCQVAFGIGSWIEIWSIVNFASIFTNGALLYLKSERL